MARDLDGDGEHELVVTELGHIVGFTCCALSSLVQGAFGPSLLLDVALSEFDGDGQLDVAVLLPGAHAARRFWNSAAGERKLCVRHDPLAGR